MHRTVIHVVDLLVRGEYKKLEALSGTHRLTAMELREAVEGYGRRLTMPPSSSFENMNVIEINNSNPRQWYVGVDLWTVEEGRSDLTLEFTLTDSSDDLYLVELNDLHVL